MSVKSAEAIYELAKERTTAERFKQRNIAYERRLAYYEGTQEKGSGGSRAVHLVQSMTSTGRPLLRDVGTALTIKRVLSANRCAPIVDDFGSIIGRWPMVRVEAPGSDDKDQKKAEKQTRLLHSTFGPMVADMDTQQAQAAFFASSMGDACYLLDVDWEARRVVPVVMDPRMCFPGWRGGHRKWQLADLLIAFTMTREEIQEEYDVDYQLRASGSEKEDQISVYTYVSPRQRSIVVGDEKVLAAHTAWEFDWTPAEWWPNKTTTNNSYGTSDIKDVLQLQDFYDFALNVASDGLVEATYPIRALINPMRFQQDQLTVGPGEVVLLEEGGDIKVVAPSPPPNAARMLMEQAVEDMMAASGSSLTRQTGEQPHSSIATGRSLHAAQGPQATRIEQRLRILGGRLTRLCGHLLEMQERAPVLDKFMREEGLNIQGRYRGASFDEKIMASDIAGWYVTGVVFDDTIGVNAQQKLYVAMQGMAAKIGDDLWAREKMGIEDPLAMRKRVEEWELYEAQVQAQAQQAMQGGAQQGPGGVGSPAGPAAAPQGAAAGPSLPQPTLLQRPIARGLPASPAGGAPMGATLEAVRAALHQVLGTLRGSVYAVGDLALGGQSQMPDIRITDHRDYRVVKAVIEALGVIPRVKAQAADSMPAFKEALV